VNFKNQILNNTDQEATDILQHSFVKFAAAYLEGAKPAPYRPTHVT